MPNKLLEKLLSPVRWWYIKTNPELEHFDTTGEMLRATNRAQEKVVKEIGKWPSLILCGYLLIGLIFYWAFPSYFNSGWFFVGFFIIMLLAVSVGIWINRHRTPSKFIRQELRDKGIPICLHCGYNLTGNTSGTCPECGVRDMRPLRKTVGDDRVGLAPPPR